MKRRTSIMAGAVIGFVVGAVALPTAAYAITYYAPAITWNAGTTTYWERGYVTDSAGGYLGVNVKRNDGGVSPAGYLGGGVVTYMSSSLCSLTGLHYNSSAIVQLVVNIENLCGRGYYRAASSARCRDAGGTWALVNGNYTGFLLMP